MKTNSEYTVIESLLPGASDMKPIKTVVHIFFSTPSGHSIDTPVAIFCDLQEECSKRTKKIK
jgi:hypothetical protein